MQKFTKEQLVAAQTIYNQNWIDNPENFKKWADDTAPAAQIAAEQIDYLISLIPTE